MHRRVECRVPGADANPYLAFAALLAAGLHGIEERVDPGEAFAGDAYRNAEITEVPRTLRDAIQALDASPTMRALLGEEVVEHYLHAARWEQHDFDQKVTDYELVRGFERA